MKKAMAAVSLIAVGIVAGGVVTAQVQTALASAVPATHQAVEDVAPGPRGVLGLALAPMSDEIAARFNITKQDGLVVVRVMPNSPAATAGVKEGDVLTTINGAAIKTMADLRTATSTFQVGTPVNLVLVRQGQTVNLAVTPTDAPAQVKPGRGHGPRVGGPGTGFGLPFRGDLKDVPRDQVFDHMLSGQFNYKDKNGATVTAGVVFGKVKTATDTSVTITRNDNNQDATFQINADTKLRGKGSDLKAGDKVVVTTKNSTTTAAGIMNLSALPKRGKPGQNPSQGNSGNPSRTQDFRTEIMERFQKGEGVFGGMPALPFRWGERTVTH